MSAETKYTTTGFHQPRPRAVLHYWGRRGGGSDVTLFLARHLSQAAEPVDVTLSLVQQNNDMELFRATGLPIVTFDRPHLSTLWRDTWLLPGRLRAHADTLAALRPAAVIVTMNAPFAWPFTGLLQRRGINVFYIAHDAEPHPGDYAATWQRLTQDRLIKTVNKVVALSSSVGRTIAERIPAAGGKVTVIPLETIYPTQPSSLGHQQSMAEPIRLLFYGRLLPYKGLNLLAEALEPLRRTPNWRLTIAGSGPLERDIRETFTDWPQVKLQLGWMSQEETVKLFSTHDLLLCPYIEASQSGVVAQALSWGMPSLVMPTGALSEQIGFGKAGIVAEKADADGFRQALRLVLERPGSLKVLAQGAVTLLAERQANRSWSRLVAATL